MPRTTVFAHLVSDMFGREDTILLSISKNNDMGCGDPWPFRFHMEKDGHRPDSSGCMTMQEAFSHVIPWLKQFTLCPPNQDVT